MGVRTPEPTGPPPRPRGPGLGPPLGVSLAALVLLLVGGPPLGGKPEGGVAGLFLRLVLDGASLVVELDETGRAVVGRLLAASLAALAAGVLCAAVARRHAADDARWAGLLLALGTTLAGASRAYSGEAPATLAVALALLLLVRAEAEDDPRLAERAGLPLALAPAFQPSSVVLAAALALATIVRWRTRLPLFALWAAPGLVLALLPLGADAEGASPPEGGPLELLFSPARGALVFAPVALVGLAGVVRALRARRPRFLPEGWPWRHWLPLACTGAALGHLLWVGVRAPWDEGPFWGPRLVSPAWPPLLLFLPEGLLALRLAGVLVAVVSVAVQALGSLAYDGRWDRLHRTAMGRLGPARWNPGESPIAFQLGERVVRLAVPGLDGNRLVVREHPLVIHGPHGSRIAFAEPVLVTGTDVTLGHVHLEGGARVEGGRLALRAPGDGLFLRVSEGARVRRLELRLAGRGRGTLSVTERTFWTAPRGRDHPVQGGFRLRQAYFYPESGGPDVRITLATAGKVELESVALVPPREPENVIRLP